MHNRAEETRDGALLRARSMMRGPGVWPRGPSQATPERKPTPGVDASSESGAGAGEWHRSFRLITQLNQVVPVAL